MKITAEKYTHIIWDFNGTLLDDVGSVVKANNVLLRRRGLKEISGIKEYLNLVDTPMLDFYQNIGFDFSEEDFVDVANEWSVEYKLASKDAPLFDGIPACLEHFRSHGITQLVLSASEKSLLQAQLKGREIAGYFSEILGLGDFHTIDKTRITREWKARNPNAVPVIIGDTEHDVEMAELLGCDCILKEGGHRNRASLLKHGVPVISDVKELF